VLQVRRKAASCLGGRSLEELAKRWRQEDEEAREIRRGEADWDFIRSQPPRLRSALECFVECGDLHLRPA